MSKVNESIRNVAIIAHVDHGKTTLVDGLLKQTGTFEAHEEMGERILDSHDLERERGITIFSKNCAIRYKDVKINLVDTPGHADFGGEVERVLGMVDGVLLLVDAFEGPMPQTIFVLRKALKLNLKTILVINKIDRLNCDPQDVLNRVYDLFIDLGASEELIEFPVVYASARDGYAENELANVPGKRGFIPLLDAILESVPPPKADIESPLSMQVTAVQHDDYIKKLAVGRIRTGRLRVGEAVAVIDRDGKQRTGKIAILFSFVGLGRVKVQEADAGDIVAVAGLDKVKVGETITDPDHPTRLPIIEVEPPTLSLKFGPCTSPFAGREGDRVTSRQIRERLYFEAENDLALKVQNTEQAEVLNVSGRGELHLSILIETMRREGYEMAVGKPTVILREIDGKTHEPYEFLVVDVPDEFAGAVIERLGRRKGIMIKLASTGSSVHKRLEFEIATRGTLGLRSELMTETKGSAIMTHSFLEYRPFNSELRNGRQVGALVAKGAGRSSGYAIFTLQARGVMFISPQLDVFEGMIVGECAKEQDLDINVCKGKNLTNVRTSSADEKLFLTPPRSMSLEQCLEFINDDELLEVTPKSLRLRKKILDPARRRVVNRAVSKA